jgi:hypothetical protein
LNLSVALRIGAPAANPLPGLNRFPILQSSQNLPDSVSARNWSAF